MGSSGMKRKGRKHLPKVGTRQANEYERHDRQQASMHPFSSDPFRERRSPVLAIVIGIVVVLAIVSLLVLTL